MRPPNFLTAPPNWGLDYLAAGIATETAEYVRIYRAQNRNEPYRPDPDDWGFACGAIYKGSHGGPWNTLEYPRPKLIAKTLRSSWGVNRRGDLLSCVYGLLVGGHREDFRMIVSAATGLDPSDYAELDARLANDGDEETRWRLHQARVNSYGVRGTDFTVWDFARAIMLCSAGTAVGLLNRAECVDLMRLVQAELQARYPDWLTLGRDFSVSRWFWNGEEEGGIDRLVDSLARINSLFMPGAVWQWVPYDLALPPRDGAFVRALAESGVVVPMTEDEREQATTWELRLDDLIRAGGVDPSVPRSSAPGVAPSPTSTPAPNRPPVGGESKRAVRFGATVVDLRRAPYRSGPPSGEEGWLLSLAAPFIESHALYHDGVAPIPPRDADWSAHLAAVYPRLADIDDWSAELERLAELPDPNAVAPGVPDYAVWALNVAYFTFVCRVGVAVGAVKKSDAIERIRAASTVVRSSFSSWVEYAAALGLVIGDQRGPSNTPYRVILSDLLEPGLPWGDVPWASDSPW